MGPEGEGEEGPAQRSCRETQRLGLHPASQGVASLGLPGANGTQQPRGTEGPPACWSWLRSKSGAGCLSAPGFSVLISTQAITGGHRAQGGSCLSVLGLRLRPCNSSPTPLPPDPRGSLSSLHSSLGPSCQNTRPGIFQKSTCSPGLPAGTETFRSEASGGDSFLHSSPHPSFHPMTLNADSRAAKGFLPESVYFSVAE